MEVRTAPWASSRARVRLAEIEAALAADPAAALQDAADAAGEHARRVEEDVLLLYAGGNVPAALSPPPAIDGVLRAQPSMGYPGDKYQAGLGPLDVLEVAVARLIADVMGARFAEVRPTSATLANLAVYTALAQPGDTIAVLPGWAGGHLSHHAVGAAGVRGVRVAELPYDVDALDVDLGALDGFLAREQPVLVVVGASLMLRPHRVRAIAALVHDRGARLLYDASHVAGLIAEGRFQAPLDDGADLMTFSTYKSFGGPAGGVIVGDDEELMARVTTAAYPGLLANYDLSRLLPLGQAALAHLRWAGEYADACIANAQALEAALAGEGLGVVGPTASHHVCLDALPYDGGTQAALRLAEVGILLSEIGLPTAQREPAGGLRIGTQSITHQRFTPAHMPEIAAALAAGLRGEDVRADVRALRQSVASRAAPSSTSASGTASDSLA